MGRPVVVRVDTDLATAARGIASRSGWRASEVYIVLTQWVKPKAPEEPVCSLPEAVRVLEVVLDCAEIAQAVTSNTALLSCHRTPEFQSVLKMVQESALHELQVRHASTGVPVTVYNQ